MDVGKILEIFVSKPLVPEEDGVATFTCSAAGILHRGW